MKSTGIQNFWELDPSAKFVWCKPAGSEIVMWGLRGAWTLHHKHLGSLGNDAKTPGLSLRHLPLCPVFCKNVQWACPAPAKCEHIRIVPGLERYPSCEHNSLSVPCPVHGADDTCTAWGRRSMRAGSAGRARQGCLGHRGRARWQMLYEAMAERGKKQYICISIKQPGLCN